MDESSLGSTKLYPMESYDMSRHILEDVLRWWAHLHLVWDARGSIETVSRVLGEVSGNAAYSPMGVGVRSILHIASKKVMF